RLAARARCALALAVSRRRADAVAARRSPSWPTRAARNRVDRPGGLDRPSVRAVAVARDGRLDAFHTAFGALEPRGPGPRVAAVRPFPDPRGNATGAGPSGNAALRPRVDRRTRRAGGGRGPGHQ